MFLSILFFYRYVLYTGIRKNKSGIYDKYNTLFIKKNNTYNTLFIGSSRSEMHFNPKVFDSILKTNSFNFGISGASTKLSFSLLKTYIHQNKKPNLIIYNIDYFALDSDSAKIINFPRFFPYLSNELLRHELYNMDSRFYSFYINPIHSLPYTQFDYISSSVHGWFNIQGKYDSLMYKGFQTSISQSFNNDTSIAPTFNSITKENENYIDSIIAFTNKHNIQLIALTSPFYQNNLSADKNQKKALSNQLNKIFQKQRIPYFDYSDSIIYLNKSLFSDYIHLNHKGSYKFSVQLSQILNNNSSLNPFFNK
jgi:hypothetical protein